MRRSTRTAFACAVVMLALGGVHAQDPAADPLEAQARFWETHGRDDLAREAWKKRLLDQPDDRVALEALARLEARTGADVPGRPGVPQAGGPALSATQANQLRHARRTATAGRYDEAVVEYRKVFGGDPPDGPLALEYWQTVGGTKDGWDPARDALERLARDHPDDANFQMAFAQHLSYREATRRRGLDRFEALAELDAGQVPVQRPWRDALLWLVARRSDEERYRKYLSRYGEDTRVSRKLAGIGEPRRGGGRAGPARPADRLGIALGKAYRHLDANRIAQAESGFVAIRSNWPDAAAGTAGLGIVRLRQGRFGEARHLLETASRSNPARAGKWRQALGAARFWEEVQLGQSARDAGEHAEAERHFRTALTRDPEIGDKEVFVGVALGDELVVLDRLGDAETVYRGILRTHPGHPEATRGLIGVLMALRRNDEAVQLAATLPEGELLLLQALVADPLGCWPEDGRALQMLRGALSGPAADPSLRIFYTGLLHDLKQETEFDVQLAKLGRTPDLTPQQAALVTDLRIAQRLDQADAVRLQGNLTQAYELLEPLMRARPEDLRIVLALARVYDQAGEPDRSLALYRYAIQLDPRSYEAHAGAVLAANKLGDAAEADRFLDDALRLAPDDPRAYQLAATLARARGEDGRALAFLEHALEAKRAPGSGGPCPQRIDPDLEPVGSRTAAASTAASADFGAVEVSDAPRYPMPDLAPPRLGYGPPPVKDTEEDAIPRQIAEIEAKRAAVLGGGLALRTRGGVRGLDRLDDIEVPVELQLSGIDPGRLTLRATPVFLDAGSVSGSKLPLFGTLALSSPVTGAFKQSEEGVGLDAAYELSRLRIDIGTTPLGFPVTQLIGGLKWTPQAGHWVFGFDVSRRPVIDSLLSYAGTRDPRLDKDWGGVTATGGRIDVVYDFGRSGVYANGDFHVYVGKDVKRNDESGFGIGAYHHLVDQPGNRITIGVNITTFFFDENLRRFTFGHGGYFSPQHYLAVAIPAEWQGSRGSVSWRINGALGLQKWHEDGQSLYPDDPELQAAVEALSGERPELAIATGYPSQSRTGVGYSFGAQLEYQLTSNLVAGATAGFDNARDYDETRVLGYLRYGFGKKLALSVPPRPVAPFYDYPP